MPVPGDARDWLRLVLANGLGPRQTAALAERFDSPLDWARASSRELGEAGLAEATVRSIEHPDPERLANCLDWLEGDQRWLITWDDPLYPPLLRRIPDAPVALFATGQPELLVRPQLGIVGSRKASPGGLEHARYFAASLAAQGFVITSGLAAGIDGTAHQACLDAGGATVAVAGTGLDQVYPAQHRDLARQIFSCGVLISQFPPGTPPRPGHFPVRNRLISGMSLGVLVVEAGLKSGSLITARLAGEQGREVFAIPGSILNPQSRGCHRLIREGARLVESPDEVADELAPLARELAGELEHLLEPKPADLPAGLVEPARPPHIHHDPEYVQLLEAIGFDPTAVDDIIERSQLTPAAVSSMLLMLELDGQVCAHAGGRYSRMTPRKD